MFERYDRPVRCAEGHVFTTTWMPLVSLKAVRLGRRRYQRCPVGNHWTTVEPIDDDTATVEELTSASAVHDTVIP
jgi:hypothetical protein